RSAPPATPATPAATPAPPAPRPAPPAAPASPRPDDRRPAGKPAAAPGPILLSKEDFLNDPGIRDALEIFKGQIVEVRAPGGQEPADAAG
ncbi:MAG: hypothetical protein ACKO3N_04610, partial [Verrucomicrobiota bacterium]